MGPRDHGTTKGPRDGVVLRENVRAVRGSVHDAFPDGPFSLSDGKTNPRIPWLDNFKLDFHFQ